MCGIFGFIADKPRPISSCLKSLSAIAHRGPDGSGIAVFRSPGGSPELYGATLEGSLDGAPVEWRDMPQQLEGGAAVLLGHRRLAIVELSSLGHQPMRAADGSAWIVFNGEIYNHVELRTEL